MARPRAFDERVVIQQAAKLFAELGFNGTSIDDLVSATGLMRGSLYKAFGSKRNLFQVALNSTVTDFNASPFELDLLTVALKDLAAEDQQIAKTCEQIIQGWDSDFARVIGENLINKAKGKS